MFYQQLHQLPNVNGGKKLSKYLTYEKGKKYAYGKLFLS